MNKSTVDIPSMGTTVTEKSAATIRLQADGIFRDNRVLGNKLAHQVASHSQVSVK